MLENAAGVHESTVWEWNWVNIRKGQEHVLAGTPKWVCYRRQMQRSLNLSCNLWSLRFAQKKACSPGPTRFVSRTTQWPLEQRCSLQQDAPQSWTSNFPQKPISGFWKGKKTKAQSTTSAKLASKDGHATNRKKYPPAPGITVAAKVLQVQQRFVVHVAGEALTLPLAMHCWANASWAGWAVFAVKFFSWEMPLFSLVLTRTDWGIWPNSTTSNN